MISYCIAVFRARYSTLLIKDLCHKTTAPYEILLWLNLADPNFERFIADLQREGYPVKIVGKTPENIGMAAYGELFRSSRYEMVTQIEMMWCACPGA